MNSQTVSEHIIFVFRIWIGSYGYDCLELFGDQEIIKLYRRNTRHLPSE